MDTITKGCKTFIRSWEKLLFEDSAKVKQTTHQHIQFLTAINHLTPNGHYTDRTAQLTSRCSILCVYSTNIRTEYFKHAA